MILFNHQNLFDSGPTRLHVGGLSLRHSSQPAPYADGTHLITQGREARPITQTGSLMADTPQAVTDLLDAIEDQIDGSARELIDDSGRVWPDVVMLRLSPGPLRPVGPRCRADYTIDYLQVQP